MTFPNDDPSQPWPGSPPPWWGTRGWGPRTAGTPRVHPSQLRIDNAERARVTDALCKHFADGRLDEAEFNDRAARAAAAKTRADLAPLLADLPPLDHPQPPEVHPVPRRTHPVLWAVILVLCAPFALAAMGIVVGGVFGFAHAVGHLVPVVVVAAVIYLIARRRGHHHGHHHHDHLV